MLTMLCSTRYAHAVTVRYVDHGSSAASPGGTSWSDSFLYLQDALDISGPTDVIKVAGGSYRPDQDTGSTSTTDPDHTPDDRNETFTIPAGVKVEGGYAGSALPSTPGVRNTILYPTHLTGEIGNTASLIDNSIQVVTIAGDATNTILDGLIIEYGYADHNNDVGVGIAIPEPAAKPTIKNCAIQFNTNINNASHGAGIFITGDQLDTPDVILENCTFNFNYAANGSCIACRYANPTVKDCLFSTNAVAVATSPSALQGGAGESSGVDGFEMASRWIAFEQWVSANPVGSFPGSQAAYDAWARVQLTRIVQEGRICRSGRCRLPIRSLARRSTLNMPTGGPC